MTINTNKEANVPKLKHILWGLSVLLIIAGVVMQNLAVMYSSIPHYHQMGWAIFCSLNGIWILALGVISLLVAESHDVAMRQLDWDQGDRSIA